MLVNCNIGYYDDYGNLINGVRATAKHYMRRWDGLLLDITSILPIEMFSLILVDDHHIFHYFMLIHMLRFVHIKQYLKSLQSKIDIKYVSRSG